MNTSPIPLLRRLPATIRPRDAGWWAVPAWILLLTVTPSLPGAFLGDMPGLQRLILFATGSIGALGLLLGVLRSPVPTVVALAMLGLPALLFGLIGPAGNLLFGISAVIAIWALLARPPDGEAAVVNGGTGAR